MGRAFLLSSLLGTCTLLAGCGEDPFIVLPGGALAGEVADPPADWSEHKDVDEVQLETQPEDPYSVNLWVAAIGPDIYVATGEDGTNWTENIDRQRDVRLRIGTTVFELEARAVTDQAERASVAAEYVRKYDVDVDDNWVQAGKIYRLDRR